MPRMQIRVDAMMPPSDWNGWRETTLDDIGKRGKQVVRANAPDGYGGLKDAATYRIVNARGKKDRTGDRVDLKPRQSGGKVHNLYHIAEAGRGVSVAGFNRRKAASDFSKGTGQGGKTGRKVLAIRYGGRTVFAPRARGYRGTYYLRKSIQQMGNEGVPIITRNLEDYWEKQRRVT